MKISNLPTKNFLVIGHI